MTFEPVLPMLLLLAVAAAIVAARVVVLRRMAPTSRTRTVLWRWAGLTLAALLLVAAAARPMVGTEEQGPTRVAGDTEPNVFLVVDRSPDMRVEDWDGDRARMAGVRDDIAALMDRYPDARFAVITFSSRPSLDWPLSADTWSLRPVMAAVTPYAATPDAIDQANPGAAGNVLRYQLIGASQQYPRAQNLVFYFGAGAAGAQAPQREFDLPAGTVDGGAVLGYGTAAGGPIPGTDARSAVDEAALRGVADQIGVPYVPRDATESLTAALPQPAEQTTSADVAAAPAGRTELYWVPAVGAAILILIELYLVLREFRRTRLANADVVV
nr:VWA domain-containing protein [Mycobacterium sp. URHB0044]